MKKQTTILFYILSLYVIVQFIWWAFYLVELTTLVEDATIIQKRTWMIIGEGLVFFLVLLLGLLKIRSSIQKEIKLSKQKNNFLLSVTHELKTPLTTNKLYLQTLLKRSNLPKAQQNEILQQAIFENQRLEEMIDNILMAARIEGDVLQLNFEEINLSKEFTQIIEDWSEKRIPVHLNIELDVIAKVDLFVVKTILYNLLENAYKYAGKEAIIQMYLYRNDNQIVFGVKDNGKGIPSIYKTDIFNKFVRIGNEEIRNQKGTGLGLYIVRKMVEYHHGYVQCLDNIPKGANFKITLNERS